MLNLFRGYIRKSSITLQNIAKLSSNELLLSPLVVYTSLICNPVNVSFTDSLLSFFSTHNIVNMESNKIREYREKLYYTPFDVVVHNKPDDCWVTLLGKVLNITGLIQDNLHQRCVKPLIALAGKDISHWFDANTGNIQTYIHKHTGVRVPYCPHGPLPHVPPEVPTERFVPFQETFWWKDPKYHIGYLTKKVRPIRIINMLIQKEVTLNVCEEDTIGQIMERYRIFNSALEDYIWRYMDNDIDVEKTLEENGIIDEREVFTDLYMPANYYIPCIFLYYKDKFPEESSNSSEED